LAQPSAPATRSRDLDSTHAALNGHRVKIRASNMSFYYGRFRALNDVTLSIAEHKITALIGPSGCGKRPLRLSPSSLTGRSRL
jgi:ABC-type bacteriocin/lantibiotic exporter with double-glycine peptidase domain